MKLYYVRAGGLGTWFQSFIYAALKGESKRQVVALMRKAGYGTVKDIKVTLLRSMADNTRSRRSAFANAAFIDINVTTKTTVS